MLTVPFFLGWGLNLKHHVYRLGTESTLTSGRLRLLLTSVADCNLIPSCRGSSLNYTRVLLLSRHLKIYHLTPCLIDDCDGEHIPPFPQRHTMLGWIEDASSCQQIPGFETTYLLIKNIFWGSTIGPRIVNRDIYLCPSILGFYYGLRDDLDVRVGLPGFCLSSVLSRDERR